MLFEIPAELVAMDRVTQLGGLYTHCEKPVNPRRQNHGLLE